MAKAETTSTRLPRGTKPVAQAFFAALDTVPDAEQSAVAKAAQILIRDGFKTQREKARTTAVSAAARMQVKRATKAAPKTAKQQSRARVAKPVRRVARRSSTPATAA